ncbi:ICP6 [Psittacid alphaherpesvirus 1]|uniref:Ribonucleoside-diphosphate reductase large subunit n=1 Tax=Psittacid herpesvirus 1 (isolate Amazon parrot/-/97-0001/1997) TaxID=670426 RepID=RIR1_PSHV1|nr:ribonucleotide reductase subunit 1 [Psittacid alphaherpesvirus 1]Q6UDJ2.1 RecName: Full=Ribonucleoside-diphosphate reductase large subunit; Short=R1; AltName: Full=Ribonucleotide reductase large subunit [Psittacid herpesvirus 1 Amazon parrot/1997]AAQ73718.1 ICP6 [Psittacid alphaherpesvirus 1]
MSSATSLVPPAAPDMREHELGECAAFYAAETPQRLFENLLHLENALKARGYDTDSAGAPALGPTTLTMEAIADRITLIINRFKAAVRLDLELYRLLAELVHIRIRTKTVSMQAWIELRGLSRECAEFILERKNFVCELMERFGEVYPTLSRVGLQSARKFESMYLGKLKNGRLESVGQFFLRIAAEAARGVANNDAFAAAVFRDGTRAPDANTVFCLFFMALCRQEIVPPTPVMLFAGTESRSYASCFLLDVRGRHTRDVLTSIAEEIIPVMHSHGGIGLYMDCDSNWDDNSSGMMLALKALDSIIAASNAVSARPSGLCVYVEPWHRDIMKILRCRGVLAGNEETRCDNTFFALWMPDLFMKRFEANGTWTLFDGRAAHLSDLYGEEFEKEYELLERKNVGIATYPARDVMFALIKSAVSTGTPFVMFKHAVNRNYFFDMAGRAMKCSNLCTEIVHMTDDESVGVCNLTSLNLAAFVTRRNALPGTPPIGTFDYSSFRDACAVATVFINALMSLSNLPIKRATTGNERLRSIGIGVQGFHTACLLQGFGLDSVEACRFNGKLFEALALTTFQTSCRICELGMNPFRGFSESKYAKGWLHMDGWPARHLYFDGWDRLRENIKAYGLYNCQLVALMPTASSSQLTEVSEGIHPVFGNIFSKITTTGEDIQLNVALMETIECLYPNKAERRDILERLHKNKWSTRGAFGAALPSQHPLTKFDTAFEADQEHLLRLSADRAPFVDHSQSTTLYVVEEDDGAVRASRVAHLLTTAFKYGLKTGMYYCKVRKATDNGVFLGTDTCRRDDPTCLACQ